MPNLAASKCKLCGAIHQLAEPHVLPKTPTPIATATPRKKAKKKRKASA